MEYASNNLRDVSQYINKYNLLNITIVGILFEALNNNLPFDEDNDLACDIATAVSDAHLFELIQDIEYLYAEDRIDETITGEFDDFIDMIYNYDYDNGNVHYIDDVIKEMECWSCFEKPNEKKREKEYNFKKLEKELDLLNKLQGETDRKVKIGRNELCPCGSGKKYMIVNTKYITIVRYGLKN